MRVRSEGVGVEIREHASTLHQEAYRCLEELRSHSCKGGELCGWFDWPKSGGQEMLEGLDSLKKQIDVPYDTVVVIGIGGSFAGAKAVSECFKSSYFDPSQAQNTGGTSKELVYAGHNLSEEELSELIQYLDGRQPIVNVVSKSGKTIETAITFRILLAYMRERFGIAETQTRVIVTTSKDDGLLRRISDGEGFKSISIPENVGGRFSVLTGVGMLPLALGGFSVKDLLGGASSLFQDLLSSLENFESDQEKVHPVIEHACLRQAAWEKGIRIDLFSYVHPKLSSFVEWWKQLFGESEGKDERGLFPASAIYSTDLHSLGQYIQEGWPKILQTFLLLSRVFQVGIGGSSSAFVFPMCLVTWTD